MERLIGYSQKSEKEVDAQMGGNQGGYNNQRTSQPEGGQQNNGVTYQRGTPAPSNMPDGPNDDWIPF